mgnify:CR=1 FL=1
MDECRAGYAAGLRLAIKRNGRCFSRRGGGRRFYASLWGVGKATGLDSNLCLRRRSLAWVLCYAFSLSRSGALQWVGF